MKHSEYFDDELKNFSKENNERIRRDSKWADALKILIKILQYLRFFKGNYHKKLNITRMFDKLRVPVQQRESYIELIMEMQELFQSTFYSHSLKLKEIDKKLYLTTNRLIHSFGKYIEKSNIPKKITFSEKDLSLLNDIIYVFTNIRRGKGFNLSESTSNIVKAVKKLRKQHPYLFFSNGHGLIFPTKFGIDLGNKINSYLKCNRLFESISLQDSIIRIK